MATTAVFFMVSVHQVPAALVEELTKWRREATDHWEYLEDSGITTKCYDNFESHRLEPTKTCFKTYHSNIWL